MKSQIMRILIVIILVTTTQVSFADVYKTNIYNGFIGGFIASGDTSKYRNSDNNQVYDLNPKDFAKCALGIGMEYEKTKSLCFPLTLELFTVGDKEYSSTYIWPRDGKSYPVNDEVKINILALTGETRYKFSKEDKNIVPYIGVGTGLYWWNVRLDYDYYYETASPGWYYLWREREKKSDKGIDLGFHITAGLLHASKFFIEGKYRILKTDIGDGLSYNGFQINLGHQYKW